MESGQTDLTGGGAIGFSQFKFTQPPIVFLTIVRHNHFSHKPMIVYITSINKDSFGYNVKNCDGSNYHPVSGDKLNWLALES